MTSASSVAKGATLRIWLRSHAPTPGRGTAVTF